MTSPSLFCGRIDTGLNPGVFPNHIEADLSRSRETRCFGGDCSRQPLFFPSLQSGILSYFQKPNKCIEWIIHQTSCSISSDGVTSESGVNI